MLLCFGAVLIEVLFWRGVIQPAIATADPSWIKALVLAAVLIPLYVTGLVGALKGKGTVTTERSWGRRR
jgi:hypothetical protein